MDRITHRLHPAWTTRYRVGLNNTLLAAPNCRIPNGLRPNVTDRITNKTDLTYPKKKSAHTHGPLQGWMPSRMGDGRGWVNPLSTDYPWSTVSSPQRHLAEFLGSREGKVLDQWTAGNARCRRTQSFFFH
jgi:hypothetical protein